MYIFKILHCGLMFSNCSHPSQNTVHQIVYPKKRILRSNLKENSVVDCGPFQSFWKEMHADKFEKGTTKGVYFYFKKNK